MTPSQRHKLDSAASRTRTDRLQAQAADASAYIYNSRHWRFAFLDDRKVRKTAQTWISTYEAATAAGLDADDARERADVAAREAMSWTIWILAGQLILRLLYEWWVNREASV